MERVPKPKPSLPNSGVDGADERGAGRRRRAQPRHKPRRLATLSQSLPDSRAASPLCASPILVNPVFVNQVLVKPALASQA